MYYVVDNVFNRHWYPQIIGKRYVNPPSYAAVRDEFEELSAMDTDSLIMSWNGFVLNQKTVNVEPEATEEFLGMIHQILTNRNVSHEFGKVIDTQKENGKKVVALFGAIY